MVSQIRWARSCGYGSQLGEQLDAPKGKVHDQSLGVPIADAKLQIALKRKGCQESLFIVNRGNLTRPNDLGRSLCCQEHAVSERFWLPNNLNSNQPKRVQIWLQSACTKGRTNLDVIHT